MTAAPTPPLRVVYVVSLFPCWSETFIVREIEALIARGVDVRILSLKAPSEALVHPRARDLLARTRHPRGGWATFSGCLHSLWTHPRASGGALLSVLRGLWRQPRVLAKTLVALARAWAELPWLRALAPHYLHAHWATYPSTAALALARALGRPFGFTCHAHDIFVEDQLLARKLDEAALAVTISRYNVDHLAPWRCTAARSRLEIVHCGVDLQEFAYRRAGRMPGLVLAVGRLDPIKGFDVLLQALAGLRDSGRKIRCRILGEGPERGRLEALRAQLGLEASVELPGAAGQDGVRAAMAEAQLFVMPSVIAADGNRDGIPVALMEAMATGLPAIGTTVSGIPELIDDGRDGLLVVPGDPHALATALVRLIDDDALADRLATAARERIEREFDADCEGARLLGLIDEVAHV